MAHPVIDVAVFPNVGVQSAPIEMLTTYPPLNIEVTLGQGVSIAPILPTVADYVFKLCSPHALKTEPVRQYEALYAFIRDGDADESGFVWDRDERLQT